MEILICLTIVHENTRKYFIRQTPHALNPLYNRLSPPLSIKIFFNYCVEIYLYQHELKSGKNVKEKNLKCQLESNPEILLKWQILKEIPSILSRLQNIQFNLY
jgi:hypothetical protein